MAILRIPRMLALMVGSVASVIVLGLSADLMMRDSQSEGLSVGIAAVSFVTLVAMTAIDILRQGAWSSRIIVEVCWLNPLWILWLFNAAIHTSSVDCFVPEVVSRDYNPQGCQESQAVAAFSYITWLILMAYAVTLLVYALIAHARGEGIWNSSVRETDFSTRAEKSRPQGKGHVEAQPADCSPSYAHESNVPQKQAPLQHPHAHYSPPYAYQSHAPEKPVSLQYSMLPEV